MESKEELVNVFVKIEDREEMGRLLEELLTPKEMSDLCMRWQLMKELHEGNTQRSIAAKHRMSLCKITRGSKILKKEDSAVRRILEEERYR